MVDDLAMSDSDEENNSMAQDILELIARPAASSAQVRVGIQCLLVDLSLITLSANATEFKF